MKKHQIYIFVISLFVISNSFGQDSIPDAESITNTFNETRIVNMQSVDVLERRILDIRITHRFGDVGGKSGGSHNLYGLDNISDIRLGVEYGASENLTLGFGRVKGSGEVRELWELFVKYKYLSQTTDNSSPLSITLFTNMVQSSMVASSDSTSSAFFRGSHERISYLTQLIFAKKFSERFSMQISPTYFHRNLVPYADNNGYFAFGYAAVFQLTKKSGITLESYSVLDKIKANSANYYTPIGLGYELKTGKNVFQINLTNSRGIIENEFLAYNPSDIRKGEFRFGFTFSRKIGM